MTDAAVSRYQFVTQFALHILEITTLDTRVAISRIRNASVVSCS